MAVNTTLPPGADQSVYAIHCPCAFLDMGDTPVKKTGRSPVSSSWWSKSGGQGTLQEVRLPSTESPSRVQGCLDGKWGPSPNTEATAPALLPREAGMQWELGLAKQQSLLELRETTDSQEQRQW